MTTSALYEGMLVWDQSKKQVYSHFEEKGFYPGARTLTNSSIKSGYLVSASEGKSELAMWRWDSQSVYAKCSTGNDQMLCGSMLLDGRYCIVGSKPDLDYLDSFIWKTQALGDLDWKVANRSYQS